MTSSIYYTQNTLRRGQMTIKVCMTIQFDNIQFHPEHSEAWTEDLQRMHTQYIYDNKRIYDNLLHPEHSEAWTEDLRRELNGTLLPCETGFFWMVLFFFLCSTELFFLCSTELYCRVRQGFFGWYCVPKSSNLAFKVEILRSKFDFAHSHFGHF